jgi:hypothetical protein
MGGQNSTKIQVSLLQKKASLTFRNLGVDLQLGLMVYFFFFVHRSGRLGSPCEKEITRAC